MDDLDYAANKNFTNRLSASVNIAGNVRRPSYRVKLAMQQVAKFPLELLKMMYDELVETIMKCGIGDKQIKKWTFTIVHSKNNRKIKIERIWTDYFHIYGW